MKVGIKLNDLLKQSCLLVGFSCIAVEATLRGDSVPSRVDSISSTEAPPKSLPQRPPNVPNGSSRPGMKQRNLPPIPSDLPGRNHPTVPPPSVTRVSSNGGDQSSPQVPPPRGARRTNSSSQPSSTGVGGPPVPVRPSTTSRPQAPPKHPNWGQKPPISNRPKPGNLKAVTRTPSRPFDVRPENMTLGEKIHKIQEDAPVIIECVEQQRPGLSHQLENLALLVDSIITEANSVTNDSSVQFKRHLAALRSQTGFLRDPSCHHDVIRLVRVIEMIVTKSQQLSSHLHVHVH